MVDVTESFKKECQLLAPLSNAVLVEAECDKSVYPSKFSKASLALYEELQSLSSLLSRSFTCSSELNRKISPSSYSSVAIHGAGGISTADAITALNTYTTEWNELKRLSEKGQTCKNTLSSSTWSSHCQEVVSQLYILMSRLASAVDARNRSAILQQSAKRKYFVYAYRGSSSHISEKQLRQINDNPALKFLPANWQHQSFAVSTTSCSSQPSSHISKSSGKASEYDIETLHVAENGKYPSKSAVSKQMTGNKYVSNSLVVPCNSSDLLELPEDMKNTLEMESKQLLDIYYDDLAAIRVTQQAVTEMSQLMSFFAHKAVEQTEMSQQIAGIALETLKNVENVEIQLNTAMKRYSKYRSYIVLFFLFSSLILLCLDFATSRTWF